MGMVGITVYACYNLENQRKCGEDQAPMMPGCVKVTCGDEATCNDLMVLLGQVECDPGLLPCVCTAKYCGTQWVMMPGPDSRWERMCNAADEIGVAPFSGSGGPKATLSGDYCTDNG
jgi:hypothetical protein